MNASDAKRDPVEELAEDFARRLRRGEYPSLTEYTSRHPELAAEIQDLFPALVVMEQFGSVADPSVTVRPRTLSGGKLLGDFRIVREIARGGMGIVYEAMQESLGRYVALKVLPAGGPGASRERFRREAKAAARLHHTSIVPVFAIGEDSETLYYAMQFIRGQGLDNVLAEVRRLRLSNGTARAASPSSGLAWRLIYGQISMSRTEPSASPGPEEALPKSETTRWVDVTTPSTSDDLAAQPEARYCREVARLGIQAAEALHYAHQQGVLHRDVKPSNLLLDTVGTLWVTDFGLAKANDSEDLTRTGDLVGTLRFMAPERFKGGADARSDVYSLAVTLYEMLTLRPAFNDADRLKLIEQIGLTDPPPMRSRAPEVPRDLETVVHKAAARMPADRYATAQEFADDLRRFLDGRPVLARRHGWTEQVWRWCRRRPAVAALAAAVAGLLITVAVGAMIAAIQLQSALTQANNNLARAETAEIDADVNRWRSHLLDARSSRLSRKPGQRIAALASLRQAYAIAHDRGMSADRFDDMRTEAIAALALPDLFVEQWNTTFPPGTSQIDFNADLTTFARIEPDGAVTIRSLVDDVERLRVPAIGGPCLIRLSPDGGSLFQYQTAAPYRGRFWDISGAKPLIRFEEDNLGRNHCFRADGDSDGGRLIDTSTWTRGPRLGPGVPQSISSDGSLILLATADGIFRLLETRSGREITRLEDPDHYAEIATLSPDGSRLIALARDGLRVWDLRGFRRELSALGLDWNAPSYPPASRIEPIKRLNILGQNVMGQAK